MSKYQSTKLFDGFSTVFRQWAAEGTHCRFLHGYDIEFRLTFEGELDHRNWVWDFGGMKRAKGTIDGMNPKAWMDYMFDHTTIIAPDDPEIDNFRDMDARGVVQLRVLNGPVGAERFAQFIYEKINPFLLEETNGRVKLAQVEFFENKRNSAIYIPE
jgi:6-pyruvoyltetrahydropterin/6-carboxytetrahydropterin synthase